MGGDIQNPINEKVVLAYDVGRMRSLGIDNNEGDERVSLGHTTLV